MMDWPNNQCQSAHRLVAGLISWPHFRPLTTSPRNGSEVSTTKRKQKKNAIDRLSRSETGACRGMRLLSWPLWPCYRELDRWLARRKEALKAAQDQGR